MNKISIGTILAVLAISGGNPCWGQSEAKADFAAQAEGGVTASAQALDPLKVESLGAVILNPAGSGDLDVIFRQEAAISSVIAIYRKPSTSADLKSRIVKLLLTDAVDANILEMYTNTGEAALETAEVLYDGASESLKMEILSRLGAIVKRDHHAFGASASKFLNKLAAK